jgi:rhamnosyltransferase
MKRVTVLMSVYNGQRYLKEQIDSILNQKNIDVNIIIRDDGSTDYTINVLNEYSNNPQIQIHSGKNVGCARSFMELIYNCNMETEYYAFSDQDDFWLENKLCRAVEKLDEFPTDNESLYYSATKRVGADLEEITNPYKRDYHVEKFPGVLLAPSAAGCTMVFNQRLFEMLKKYTPQYLHMHDAWVICVCSAVKGNIFYDSESYILYRQHENNVVGKIDKMKLSPLQLLKSRIHKLLDFDYKATNVANEILKGYANDIDKDNRKKLELLNSMSTINIFRRLYIIRSFTVGYFVIDCKIYLQGLLGRL